MSRARAWVTGDAVIKAGFWSQLVLLFLVDWGTLAAFARHDVPWYHYAGFALVNGVLLGATALLWRWLSVQRSRPAR